MKWVSLACPVIRRCCDGFRDSVGLPASSTLPLHPAAAPVAFQKRTYKELSRSDYPRIPLKLDDGDYDDEDGGSRKLLQVQTVRYFCKFYINDNNIIDC
jgi:hypothetical protein